MFQRVLQGDNTGLTWCYEYVPICLLGAREWVFRRVSRVSVKDDCRLQQEEPLI